MNEFSKANPSAYFPLGVWSLCTVFGLRLQLFPWISQCFAHQTADLQVRLAGTSCQVGCFSFPSQLSVHKSSFPCHKQP